MELRFRCGECNRKLEASATMAGSTVCCPSCGASVTIPQAHLGSGVTLAGFRIEKEIGHGAMGRVFLATQLAMDRKVALKVLPSPRVSDSEFVERFFHEVRLAAQLAHPNIVSAFDAGEDHGYYYFAMAFVDGESLDSRLKRGGALAEKEALTYTLGVAEALAYAWDTSHILHRDVKPANIMVDADRRPMLMDMGIAKNVSDKSHLTATGVAVGTPHYMSPEQARGSQDLDFRTDMYSLGACLFHLVAGRVPFIGTSAVEVITKHLHDPLPSVRALKPTVTQECEDVIVRMMAKDKAHRYGSWQACIHDLQAVLRDKTPETTKTKLAKQASEHLAQQRTYTPNRPAWTSAFSTQQVIVIAIGALLALAILAIGLPLLRQDREAPGPAPARRSPRTSGASTPARLSEAGPGSEAVPGSGADPGTTTTAAAAPATAPAAPVKDAPEAGASPEPAGPDQAPTTTAQAQPATAAPAAAVPTPQPAPDPLALALRRVAGELLASRAGAALTAWDQAAASLASAQPASHLAEIRAALACVAEADLRITETFRRDVGPTPITVKLKDGQRKMVIKSVAPPVVRAMVLVDNGATGTSFTVNDLDPAERLARMPPPETAEAALARGLVALWSQQSEAATTDLKRFDTPLTRALQLALDERATEQRELAADKACAELVRSFARSTPPKEPDRLVAELRERLDTAKRRKGFEDRLKAYEEAHGNTATGARHLSSLRRVLAFPFAQTPWVVPGIGMEFTWVEAISCWAGVYEATNAQVRCLMPDHNSADAHDQTLNDDSQPAVWLSFEDAEGYAALLTKREREADRLPAGHSYRLPRADEWTALASAGDAREFPWGDAWPPPAEVNCNGSEWPGPEEARIPDHKDPYPVTCPVSKSGRNPLGLFGLGGNAMEWTGGKTGTAPELRGNAWCGLGGHPSQSAYTVASAWARPSPNFRTPATGFRLLLAAEPRPRASLADPPK